MISVHFGSVWLRSGPFGSVWLDPFRVCFGSVSGPFRRVGWGRGGVGERGFCKGKEYHYSGPTRRSINFSFLNIPLGPLGLYNEFPKNFLEFQEKKYTPKVFSALETQVPQPAKKRFGA